MTNYVKVDTVTTLASDPEYFWASMRHDLNIVMSNYKEEDMFSRINTISELVRSYSKVNDITIAYPYLNKDKDGKAKYIETFEKYRQMVA